MKLFQQHFIRFGFESQLKNGQNSGERSGYKRDLGEVELHRGLGKAGLGQKSEGRFGHSSHGFRKNVNKNITNYGVSVFGVWQR